MAINFPSTPSDGDTHAGYTYDATNGVWNIDPHQIASRFVASDTAPTNPQNGDAWYNTTTGVSLIYYVDQDSSQWIEFGGSQGAQGPQGDAGPQGPQGLQGPVASGINVISSDTIDIDFSDGVLAEKRDVSGDLVFSASNHTPGIIKKIILYVDSSNRNISFPATWNFIGIKPESLRNNTTALLEIECYGDSDSGVYVRFDGSQGLHTDNLRFWLDAADENSYVSGSSTWYDLSGNNNNFTIYNSPLFSESGGGSINFSGSPRYAQALSLSGNITYTHEFYVSLNVAQSVHAGALYSIGLNNTGNQQVGLYASNNSLNAYHYSNDQYHAANVLSQDTWAHLAVTYDGNSQNRKVYLNGASLALIFTGSGTLSLPANSPFTIGAQAGSSGPYMNGKIGEFRAYTSALEQSQIVDNFNATKTRYGL